MPSSRVASRKRRIMSIMHHKRAKYTLKQFGNLSAIIPNVGYLAHGVVNKVKKNGSSWTYLPKGFRLGFTIAHFLSKYSYSRLVEQLSGTAACSEHLPQLLFPWIEFKATAKAKCLQCCLDRPFLKSFWKLKQYQYSLIIVNVSRG